MSLPPLIEVTALAEHFRRLGMVTHLEALRAYWRARQRGRKAPWGDEMVLRWLRVLRVPPHERHYRAQGRNTPCAACASEGVASGCYTLLAFPGGTLSMCHRCQGQWLELNE